MKITRALNCDIYLSKTYFHNFETPITYPVTPKIFDLNIYSLVLILNPGIKELSFSELYLWKKFFAVGEKKIYLMKNYFYVYFKHDHFVLL